MKQVILVAFAALCLILPGTAQQKDTKGCTDHPLFTRMPTYWIHHCDQKEFDAYTFKLGQGRTERVEGRYWKIVYYPQATATSRPSDLQILRNFENAAMKLGGTMIFQEKGREIMRLNKDGKEIWVEVGAEFTGKYGLTIVEKAGMAQDFSWPRSAQKYLDLYKKLIESSNAPVSGATYPMRSFNGSRKVREEQPEAGNGEAKP